MATDPLWARIEETFGEDPKLVPTITAINFGNPWLMNEVEPNAKAVFATFGTKPEALLDVIRARYNPTGRLPITLQQMLKRLRRIAEMFRDLMKDLIMFIKRPMVMRMAITLVYLTNSGSSRR